MCYYLQVYKLANMLVYYSPNNSHTSLHPSLVIIHGTDDKSDDKSVSKLPYSVIPLQASPTQAGSEHTVDRVFPVAYLRPCLSMLWTLLTAWHFWYGPGYGQCPALHRPLPGPLTVDPRRSDLMINLVLADYTRNRCLQAYPGARLTMTYSTLCNHAEMRTSCTLVNTLI